MGAGPALRADFGQPQQLPGVPGDDQLFVRRDDPCRYTASRPGNAGAPALIRIGVQFDAEPGRGLADSAPDLRRVFADPTRENEGIQATERRANGTRYERLPAR